MPFDFSKSVMRVAQNTFGSPFTITPIVSQPKMPAYTARGIYSNKVIDYSLEQGVTNTINVEMLNIRLAEFPKAPRQLDKILLNSITYDICDIKVDGQGGADLWLKQGK